MNRSLIAKIRNAILLSHHSMLAEREGDDVSSKASQPTVFAQVDRQLENHNHPCVPRALADYGKANI
ncbi:MAG: hypothetical protein ACPHF4_07365 [Rubripirellula sp.]